MSPESTDVLDSISTSADGRADGKQGRGPRSLQAGSSDHGQAVSQARVGRRLGSCLFNAPDTFITAIWDWLHYMCPLSSCPCRLVLQVLRRGTPKHSS